MAVIHSTTMNPGKLELLTSWLPAQPWHPGTGREPELAKAGGFRLDDPAGEVGIEFMVITDGPGDSAPAYQVPLTYRQAALEGAGDALIGTAEHGVLGPRWIYDGARDPVLVAQLVALMQGAAKAQAQNQSNTPDLTVTSEPVTSASLGAVVSVVTASGTDGTELRVGTGGAGQPGLLIVRINRILTPCDVTPLGHAGQAGVAGTWRLPGGGGARAVFATARYAPAQASWPPE
jgi:hypothetical protein